MQKEFIEQYLKTILFLSEKETPVKTTSLAKKLGVAPATVTEGLQKLAADKLIKYEPYHGSSLTPKGKAIAGRIRRKHRLLERFLTDVLGLESSTVHEQACELEHGLSDKAEIALCRVMNHPETCSDDEQSIPPCGLEVESCVECKESPESEIYRKSNSRELKSLVQMRNGESRTVQFIRGGKSSVSRLQNMGLTKGTEIQMVKRAPFSGPIEVCVRGCKLALGQGVARNIFVQ